MKLILNTVLIIVYISIPGVHAQVNEYTIIGKVYTQEKEGVPMAIVRVENTTLSTTTDVYGNYSFTGLIAGACVVYVEAFGYKKGIKTIILGAEKSVSVDFFLEENVQQLHEVIIDNNIIKLKEEEGFSVDAVKLEEIQSQSIELNTVLNQTAGIRVRQDGGLGSRSQYMINGLGGKAIRFFLDGVPMDYFGSSYSVNTLPISMIDRIEVYKGVVPVELGNDALGGAINLSSKTNLSNSAEVSYSYGSFNTHRASVQGNWRDSTSGATVKLATFYNYSDNNYAVWGNDVYVTDLTTYETKRGIKAKRFHDSFESKAIKVDVGLTKKKWADQFFVGMLYSSMDKEIQHGPTMEVTYGEAAYNQHVAMPHLTYKKYDFLVKRLDVNVFTSYSNLVRARVDTSRNIYNWYGEVDGTRTLGGEQLRTLNTLTEKVFLNRFNAVYRMNENHKIGYNMVFTNLSRTDRDPLITQKTDGYWSPQQLQKNTMGLAYQSLLVDKKLNTSIFIKAHNYKAAIKSAETSQGVTTYSTVHTSGFYMGYGIASAYKLTPIFMLTASAEKAYRLPESEEILGDGLTVISTTELNPESSLNANIGFRLNLFPKKENQVAISSNLFYRDVTNLIQQWQYDMGAFVFINFDKVQMKGVDAKVEFNHKKKFVVNQTISYLYPLLKSEEDKQGNDNITYNVRLPNTPFFQTSTDIRYQFKNLIQKQSKTFVYWQISYVGEFFRHSEIIGKYDKDIIPTQFIHSCGVGYTFPKEKLSVSYDLSNLFNEQVFDNYAIQKPGRAMYIKATYRL